MMPPHIPLAPCVSESSQKPENKAAPWGNLYRSSLDTEQGGVGQGDQEKHMADIQQSCEYKYKSMMSLHLLSQMHK